MLLAAFERDAGLSPFGRMAPRRLVVQLLANRLLIEDAIARHPEILRERIERPIVIAGLPRTGTTHLHNLISQAPELRSLAYWESLEPLPARGDRAAPGAPDPRIARCQKGLDFLHRVLPLFPLMHEMTADARHEEIQLLAIAVLDDALRVELPRAVLSRLVQGHRPAARLRVPAPLPPGAPVAARSEALGAEEPAAPRAARSADRDLPGRVRVQTHRDPVRITASLCTMIAYGMRMNAARVDAREVGRTWSARVEDLLRGSVEQRPLLPAAQVIDVRFHEFMKDDLASVRRVFEFAGQPWTDAAQWAIRAYMDASPRGRHGSIDYRLEDVGLDAAERRRALRFYSERFGVPEE